MSISKRQAEALAEGFLDNLGSSKSDFQPKNTYTELFLLVGELIDTAQKNLNKAGLVSSGKGSESIAADEPIQNGGIISVDVLMNYYLQFHNKGVKGTRSGRSRAGYSFKNEVVSRNMYNAIDGWIKRAGLSTRTIRQKEYKAYGKHETRRKSIAAIDSTYAMARHIKMTGLKPSGFMDSAIKSTSDKITKRLGAALVLDIQDGLQ